VCILSYSCLKVHEQNKLLFIKSGKYVRINMHVKCPCVLIQRRVKLLIWYNKLIVVQNKQMLYFIYTWLPKKSVKKGAQLYWFSHINPSINIFQHVKTGGGYRQLL